MRRIPLFVMGVVTAVIAGTWSTALAAPAAQPAFPAGSPQVTVSAPARVSRGSAFGVAVRLPAAVAAVDGRVLLNHRAGDLLGVAPVGGGDGLRPVSVPGGYAFGAYGLRPSGGGTRLDLVIVPNVSGRVQLRVVIDSVADSSGRRVSVSGGDSMATVGVDDGSRFFGVPISGQAPRPARAARPIVELQPDGRFDKADVDVARAAWEASRLKSASCASPAGDANGDGCVDVVDLQATLAARGTRAPITAAAVSGPDAASAAAVTSHTFTVTSQLDTPDALKGDGICADANGVCTLRAGIMEANNVAGDDRIEFAIAAPAPALIQLTGALPLISSRGGNLVIDGYTQPGSRVNNATLGSNAIPGIEIRGNGSAAREVAFFITSSRNTIRGMLIHNAYRAIMIDHPDAYANRVVGNFIGFLPNGANDVSQNYAVILNTGAHDNVVGTPDLADRNVIGNYTHAVEHYGPGTNGNIVQNNVLCIRPSGLSTAKCSTGIDHNFGPKDGLIGGTGLNEKNVIGATNLQAIEYSHGYNPAVGPGDTDPTWQINGNRSIGNWLGFRGDGAYDINFRSGQSNQGSGDNGNGLNCYDGSNDNVMEANYVASRFDGIQVASQNAQRNVVRNNIIGQSPLGQAAPLTGWGVKVRLGTRFDTIVGNTISNAAMGGVGLVQPNVLYIRLSRNIITDTNGPAIDLYGVPGPDPNDPGDADNGANDLLNTPVFTSATTAAISGTAVAGGRVEVYRASRAVGQFGLPVAFLGAATVAGNGSWSLPVSLVNGDLVTALQIAPNDDTSELAANVAVGEAPPPPGPGDLLVADDFERTVSGGWGTASQGGVWSRIGTAADFSVSGGEGHVLVGNNQTREGGQAVNVAPVSVSTQLAISQLPAAGNAWVYLVARADGDTRYNGQVKITPSGALYVRIRKIENGVVTLLGPEQQVVGVTLVPGQPLGMRFDAVGFDLRLRVWDAALPEPSGWNATATDSTADLQDAGEAGVRTYASGLTNGPVVIDVDDFEVLFGS